MIQDTEIIRDATAGAITYKIESFVALGYNIIQVIMVKGDAIILYNKIKTQ